MPHPPIALYIHIPWCERKCPYCDFNSHASSKIPENDYLECLILDLEMEAKNLPSRQLGSIFIGGGTPSLFSAKALQWLLKEIEKNLFVKPDIEVTLEVNPASADAKKFLGFIRAGINRVSIGVQSFSDKSLLRLGRIHSGKDSILAVKLAQSAGFSNINIDLMYGLPNQSEEQAMEDLIAAVSLKPQHISWYELTIEPNTKFYSDPPNLPDENVLENIHENGLAFLLENGFSRYEISAFSSLGRQCKHNLNYWRFGDYLGIGAGAHSKITRQDGSITRYSKTRKPEDYLSARPYAPRINEVKLSRKETVLDFVLNAFRLTEGFTFAEFSDSTSFNPNALEPEITALCNQGLILKSSSGYKTTLLGQRYLNEVIQKFMTD